MAFQYKDRLMFHGNQRLTIAELSGPGAVKNKIFGTGLVSVSAMEDSAEITNFPADDVADHATIKGISLLSGTMTFIQLDTDVRTDFFGQETTANGKGFTTGSTFPKRLVQYVSLGKTQKGEDALLVTVYPNMSVTGQPSKSTTTDSSDAPEAIQWEAAVQATGNSNYTSAKGTAGAQFEYVFTGAEVQKVLTYIDGGGIVFPDYTPGASGPER